MKTFVYLKIDIFDAQVTLKTRILSEEPDKRMLARLRVLEKKMGLVLTLVSRLHPKCFFLQSH